MAERRRLRSHITIALWLAAGALVFASVAPVLAATPDVARLLQRAGDAVRTGNINLALIELKNAALLAPKDGNVHVRLGAMLLETGQPAAAERELRAALSYHAAPEAAIPPLLAAMLQRNENNELLKEFPDPAKETQDKAAPDILIGRAMALQTLNRPADARAAMDRSLGLRRDAPGLVNAARLAQQQDDVTRASMLDAEALKLAPGNPQALLIAVLLARQSGNTADALTGADSFIRRTPHSLIARALRIDILLDLKRDAEAKSEFAELKKQSPQSPYVAYYSGVLKARSRDYRGAWGELQNLPPEFVQSDPAIAMMVARIATVSGDTETAGTILSAVIARRPGIKDVRLQLAAVRLSQNSPARAVEILAPLKSSTDPVVQGLLAQAYLQLHKYDDAIRSLQIAVAVPNGSDLLRQQLALSQLQTGDSGEAIQALTDLAEHNPGNMQVVGALISALARASKWDEALGFANRLEKSAPASPVPRFYRGVLLTARGALTDARAALGQALAADPKFLPALYYRADVLLALGEPAAAEKDLRQVLAQDPKNTFAYVKLAQIALDRGAEKEAAALLNRAISAAPGDPAPRLALANDQYRRGDYPDAQATVTGLLQIARGNPEALALQGQLQFRRGARDEAVATFRALATGNDSSPSAYMLLARAQLAIRDAAGAEESARHAIELAPDSPQMRATLIEIEFATHRESDALETARAFVTGHPGAAADLLLAETLEHLKQPAEAEAVLEKSLATRPDSRVARQLSRMAVNIGDTKKATAVLEGWLAKNPGDFDARRDHAALLVQAGDRAGARSEYEALIRQRPDDPMVLNNLGWLLQADDPGRALTLVSRAAQIAPGSAAIADMLGWLEYQRKDTQAALPILQRAHAMDSNNAPISYHLALALDASGKRAEAKSLLQAALARNPGFDGADRARQLLARW